ncbi:hypothetical protein RJ639_006055 [Escallonia herrerae]|uniref:Uncharacterized protein n=1 Tax=Escallonia herrerae TaxID=1293975 RepID=A0AA88W0A1_9ASTE|nr:hypothetical protein RJ639_006055 [Escallonia herrerae]
MATIVDIGVAAGIIILGALVFLLAFAILRLQPFNDRVYFPKWYLKGLRSSPTRSEAFVLVKSVPPDSDESISELVEHFFLANHPDHYLTHQVVYNANKLARLVKEKESKKNWLDYYRLKYSRNQLTRPTMKTGCLGLCGDRVDAIEFQTSEIERLSKEIAEERENVTNNPRAIMPAAFVSFKTRWGAAVCAQTQQSRNPTIWLTEWASEPRDVYWRNLAIPYVSLSIRRLIIAVAFFFLTLFFMIPIAFVQSLANIEGIEKVAPFLKVEVPFIKSLIQGFLPGIALKIFLMFLPTIFMIMSKFEGFLSISALERRSASRYYLFNFVNVFLGSVISGTAFEQLKGFIHQSANEIPKTIGVAIPMKATFFITCIVVDGWAGVAGEILRLKPLIIYHSKNFFLVKTEKDREVATDPGSLRFDTGEPQIQFYFLLGLVYAVVTPLLLPFILIFFCLAYVTYRHQIINVYNQEYESAAAYWPDVHGRIIGALVISQLILMGLISTKQAAQSTPFLIALPVLTIWFHRVCKGRYEPAFTRYPLQVCMNVSDVVMCKAFPTTLRKAAHAWFKSLQLRRKSTWRPIEDEGEKARRNKGSGLVSTQGRFKRGNPTCEEREEWEENAGIINTISGSFAAGGLSGQARKAYAREVCIMSQPPSKRQNMVSLPAISFLDDDVGDVKTPHDDPLIITIKAGNFDVKCVLVDNRSSTEVLYYDEFKKMNILTNRLQKMDTPLYRFSNHSVTVEDQLNGVSHSLKLSLYAKDFAWTDDGQKSFEELKPCLSSPYLLFKPLPEEDLFLYLSDNEVAVSAVLVREGNEIQKPIYYVSKLFPTDADDSEPSLSVVMEAMMKDTLERAREPNLNLIGYLQNAYIHPVFKGDDDDDDEGEEPK